MYSIFVFLLSVYGTAMKHLTKLNRFLSEIRFSKNFQLGLFVILISLLTIPIFTQETQPNKKVDKDVVSDLKATLSSDSISIELNWTPPAEEGDIIIARSNEVIDTVEKLGVSDSLGKHKSDKANIFNFFKDQNLRPGEYYYAIVLVSQVKKKRVKLFPGVNYTIIPVVIPERAENPKIATPVLEDSHTSDSIDHWKIKNIDNSVRITWTPPHDAEKNSVKYTIYRSLDSMSNIGLLDKATKIGEVLHPETTFLDIGLNSSQTVYYGVSVTIKEKEKIPLVEDKSFRKFYFVKAEKKEVEDIKVIPEKKETISIEPKLLQVENLAGEVRKDGIHLTWSSPKDALNNSTTYYIYESKTPFINELNSKLTENAKRVGTVVHPDLSFLHPSTDKSSTAYYGVTTKNHDEPENTILKEGQSYIKIEFEAPKKKKKKKEEPKVEEKTPVLVDELNPDFDTIMTYYYKKQRFREALVKFKSLADRVSDNSLRGKSLFFAALCHYNMSEFNSALKILLKEEVQMNYDKERIDFYVKRCLENRGNK